MASVKAFGKFDDIESFWKNAEVSASPSDQSGFIDEFTYDTSSTISDVSDDEESEAGFDKESTINSVDKFGASGMSDSLSLHDNSVSEVAENDEDTDAQEFSSEDETNIISHRQSTSNDKKSERRASAPAALNVKKGKSGGRSPFDAGRLSSIGAGGSRSNPGTEDSPAQHEISEMSMDGPDFGDNFEDNDDNNGEFVDDLDWRNTPASTHSRKSANSGSPSKKRQSSAAKSKSTGKNVHDHSSSSKKKKSRKMNEESDGGGSVDEESREEHESSLLSSKKKSAGKRRVSYAPDVSTISTPGSTEFPRGRALPDDSYREEDTDDALDTTQDWDSSSYSHATGGYVDTSFMSAARKGVLSSDEEDGEESDGSGQGDSEDDLEGGMHVRRSKRVTKGQRFQFWKNERSVYVEGKMVGLLRAGPTPKKPRRGGSSKSRKRGGKGKDLNSKLKRARTELEQGDSSSSDEDGISRRLPPPPPDIPAEYDYLDREKTSTLRIWDDDIEKPTVLETFRSTESLNPPARLPISAPRPPGKEVVALAAQSFNIEPTSRMSGWISGFMELLPGAIKDAEGVGQCSQVFVVSSCQNGAVEFGLANPDKEEWDDDSAQRVLLNKGDFFFVPPGNVYRLENHSKVKSCMMYWTIIQPIASLDEDEAES